MDPQNQNVNSADSAAPSEGKPATPTTPTMSAETPTVAPTPATPVAPQAAPTAPAEPAPATSSVTAAPVTPPPPADSAASAPPPPALPGSVIGGDGQPPAAMVETPGGGKKKWVLPAAVAAVVALVVGGYVFAFYLPSQPSAMYAASLKQTGRAVDALVNYSSDVKDRGYKSYNVDATLHSTGSLSMDATLTGAADVNANAKFKFDADIMGEKVNANLTSVHVKDSNTPDLYVQLNGIKPALDSYGMSSLDSLDGEWISVDHTLLSSYAASLDENASGAAKSSTAPTSDQINDAIGKVQAVNKQYIFTSNSSKAVLTNQKFIGHETKDGRATLHYKVGYNKSHLVAYVAALGGALDGSSLNTWSKAANDGKNLSDAMRLQDLKNGVTKTNADYTFDMWVDAKTKLVHAVQFTDPSQRNSVFVISQNYTGGDSYPFALSSSYKDPSSGDVQKTNLTVTLNSSTDVSTGTLAYDAGSSANVKLKFTVTPSKSNVQVTAPVNAKPLMNVIGELGFGSGSDGTGLLDTTSTNNAISL